MQDKINKLIQSSRQVISDLCLDNGAIVAANTTQKYYPIEAVNYFFVWPRDAAYISLAAYELGQPDVLVNFLAWLGERAEGFAETGLLYTNYCPHGIQEIRTYQPDQAGILLHAIWYCLGREKPLAEEYIKVAKKTADGLISVWGGDCFKVVVNNIWEGRYAQPDLKENFSYSLAAVAGGLEKAGEMTGEDKYIQAAREMKQVLKDNLSKYGYVVSRFGEMDNQNINASALGLVYPFEVYDANDHIIQETIKRVEAELVRDYAVYRSAYDRYDGWIHKGRRMNKGAGYWPLLNFWMSIVLARMGERPQAEKYFQKVLNDTGEYIPEQIFANSRQKGVSPLGWSHAMFVLAAKELGYLG
jgi:GH15 family glucan-1,4-alpha-glucosidase